MPLTTRRSSTLGTPCDKAKNGDIRAIWRSLSRNKSPITASFLETVKHISKKLIGPDPSLRSPPSLWLQALGQPQRQKALVQFKSGANLNHLTHFSGCG